LLKSVYGTLARRDNDNQTQILHFTVNFIHRFAFKMTQLLWQLLPNNARIWQANLDSWLTPNARCRARSGSLTASVLQTINQSHAVLQP